MINTLDPRETSKGHGLPSQPVSQVPGPSPVAIVGSAGNFLGFMRDAVGYITRLHRDYGDLAALVKSPKATIYFAFGPKNNKQILSQPDKFLNVGITYPGPRDSANFRLGTGLLNMNGPTHQQHRQLMMPLFQASKLDGYADLTAEIARNVVSGWKGKDRINVWIEMKKIVKGFASRVILGMEETQEAFEIADVMEAWHNLNISAPARIFPFRIPGAPYHRMMQLADKLEDKFLKLIDRRRRELTDDKQDVLSVLIRAYDTQKIPFSHDQLIGQANLMLGASYETTANSATWALFLITQHPEVFRRVVEEAKNVYGDGPVTADKLSKLIFLERVIKESMRLLAPPVYNCRMTSCPVEVEGYELPAKTTVAISHYVTHHSSEIYPEPNKFLPDRWERIKPTPYEYLPFGAGVHACIGAAVAPMMIKTIIATVLREYRPSVPAGSKVSRKVLVTLSPRNGIPMDLVKQDGQYEKSRTPVSGDVHEMVDLK